MGAILAATEQELGALAKLILNPARKRIVCVVTVTGASSAGVYDANKLAHDTESVCDVYLVKGAVNTWELSKLLPADSNVHSNAARTYPIGYPGNSDVGMLRLGPSQTGLDAAQAKLEGDIWSAANRAGLLSHSGPGAVPTTATVKMLISPNGLLLEVPGIGFVSMSQDLVFPGVPVEWVYQEGQKLDGTYLPQQKQFVPNGSTPTKQELLEQLGDRTVTYGRVVDSGRQSATVALHPKVEFEIPKQRVTGNPRDLVSELFYLGDVVEVRIYRDEQGRPALRLDDIDGDEPVKPALSLLPGGIPWLDPDRDAVESEVLIEDLEALPVPDVVVIEAPEVEELPQPRPVPVPGSPSGAAAGMNLQQEQLYQTSIARLRGNLNAALLREQKLSIELNQLTQARNEIVAKFKDVTAQLKDKSQELFSLRKQKRVSDKTASTTFSRRSRFADDESWMREEIRRAWIGRYLPSDRKTYPLDDKAFRFGSEFFDNFTERNLDEDDARKAVRAILDLVSGRNTAEHIREEHDYLEGGRPLNRNGDIGRRMHIENGVPQAKRLVFYKLRVSGYELVKVADHDDMEFN